MITPQRGTHGHPAGKVHRGLINPGPWQRGLLAKPNEATQVAEEVAPQQEVQVPTTWRCMNQSRERGPCLLRDSLTPRHVLVQSDESLTSLRKSGVPFGFFFWGRAALRFRIVVWTRV